jgi:hypothetical protein
MLKTGDLPVLEKESQVTIIPVLMHFSCGPQFEHFPVGAIRHSSLKYRLPGRLHACRVAVFHPQQTQHLTVEKRSHGSAQPVDADLAVEVYSLDFLESSPCNQLAVPVFVELVEMTCGKRDECGL